MKKYHNAIKLVFCSICVVALLTITGCMGEKQYDPEITYGEFPFTVEYEMNGETFIIEDVVVCEFYGYDHSALFFNKPRMWKSYLKSGDEKKRTIWREENGYSILTPNRINELSRVVLVYGDAEYYMGDTSNAMWMNFATPCFAYFEDYKTDEKTSYSTMEKLSEEELEAYFDIKVIRFEFSEPIKNSFEPKQQEEKQ